MSSSKSEQLKNLAKRLDEFKAVVADQTETEMAALTCIEALNDTVLGIDTRLTNLEKKVKDQKDQTRIYVKAKVAVVDTKAEANKKKIAELEQQMKTDKEKYAKEKEDQQRKMQALEKEMELFREQLRQQNQEPAADPPQNKAMGGANLLNFNQNGANANNNNNINNNIQNNDLQHWQDDEMMELDDEMQGMDVQ